MALPAPTVGGTRPGGGGGSQPAFNFLKVENLTAEPQECTIMGVDTRGTGFNALVVKIKMGGSIWLLGLKTNSPVYEALFLAFGSNEKEWTGRKFTLKQEWNDFYQRNFIGVDEVLKDSTGKKK